ncbi:PhoX family protein [Colwellia sp. 12G3]|uniref:PhoX family protein n=1 Tax=Colwellia sp. 12G3 TaxID=2058299 RepID=UPI000C32F04E|nr:alkaline phosphatase PhoX [Colwellia sp. 12G3]PKI13984.1 cell surface protein [Colwellia sp. 12G3]
MLNIKKRKIAAVIAMILGSSMLTACGGDDGVNGTNGASGVDGTNGTNGENLKPAAKLTRVATVPVGAEITGMFLTDNDELFFNVQHPSDLSGNETPAQVGVVTGFDWSTLDPKTEDLPAPSTDAEKLAVRVVAGNYQVLGQAGDTLNNQLPHGLGSISTADQTTKIKQSQDPDFNAFVPTSANGDTGFLFTAWEDRPGAMSRIELTKEDSGSWTIGDAINVDFSAVLGTIINCFGTLSPWNTPLTSEENYEAENTAQWNNTAYLDGYPSYPDVKNLQTYLASSTLPNPYDYGYIVEVTNPTSTSPTPVKHFTLGRVAHENSVVMPDWKTVYTTDDGSNKAFYKFVATNAGDLSAGTLYAAKLTQDATSDPAKAGFNIQWIELGSSNNTQIKTWINSYNGITETDYIEGETSYITQTEIDDWATNGTGDDRYAFLETLRAAKAKGATTEFRKMEGVVINYDGVASGAVPFMYVAMSSVGKGMVDSEGDIQLDSSAYCGAVYRFGVQTDFNVNRMEPVVVGGAYNADGDENGNKCDVNAISNPDNLAVMDDGRVLIGEDTSKHINNTMWIYNPKGE